MDISIPNHHPKSVNIQCVKPPIFPNYNRNGWVEWYTEQGWTISKGKKYPNISRNISRKHESVMNDVRQRSLNRQCHNDQFNISQWYCGDISWRLLSICNTPIHPIEWLTNDYRNWEIFTETEKFEWCQTLSFLVFDTFVRIF